MKKTIKSKNTVGSIEVLRKNGRLKKNINKTRKSVKMIIENNIKEFKSK
jgi:hypothetical protein